MTGAEEARRRAAELLDAGLLGGAAPSAAILEPIPVVDPADGRLRSWFVPVAVEDGLAGFAELRPDLELLRYSSFPRPADLGAWTDPGAVRRRAAELARGDETLGEPVLSFDREPSRIAWLVTATDPEGRSRRLFVAGDFVYEESG